MTDEDKSKYPVSKSAGDYAHLGFKGVLAAIPIAGGVASELFSAVIAPPLAKRRDDFLQALAQCVAELGPQVAAFQPEALAKNDAFISAVLAGGQVALRTHDQEKLEILRDAVLNSATLPEAEGVLPEGLLFHLIDVLTPYHVRLLAQFFRKTEPGKYAGLISDFPVLSDLSAAQEAAVDLLDWNLLEMAPGLRYTGSKPILTNSAGEVGAQSTVQVTRRGNAFLSYIAEAKNPNLG